MSIPGNRAQRGLSLVDLMVGLAIGMAAMLVTLNVALSFDARRRSVAGMADAQGNAAYAITLMSRELRMAGNGLGLPAALDCTVHRAAPGSAGASFALRPVTIVAGADGAPDALETLSAGARSAPAAWLIAPYTVGKGLLQVDSTVGMARDDFLLLQANGQPDCALLKIEVLGSGSSYTVQPHNVPGLLPAAVFAADTAVVNIGLPRYRRYAVDAQQRLQMDSFEADTGHWTGATLADGIVSLQLQYGFDDRPGPQPVPQVTTWSDVAIDADGSGAIDAGDWRRLLAVRMAIVTRSAQRKDGACDAVVPQWLAGDASSGALVPTAIRVDHLPDWQCWRYRVLQSEVALRNLIWSDD